MHNDLADRVKFCTVTETVPGGRIHDTQRIQHLQVSVNGIVGGCKNGVVSSRAEKLFERGFRHTAHLYLAQQVAILAVLLVFGQIAHNRRFIKDVPCRFINFFGTTP